MAAADPELPYGRAYYESHCGIPYQRDEHWLGFFGGIADAIVERIAPTSVLDAGCAMGFLVEALRDRGVEAYGVDISDYAISQVRDDIRPHCWVGSITDPLPRRYDLIVTIEVLEHLDEATGREATRNLAAHSDDILFSSSPDDLEEETHANVQPTAYWAARFQGEGLLRDPDWEPSGGLPPWAIRFRRLPADPESALASYERMAYRLTSQKMELTAALQQKTDEAAELSRLVAAKDEHIRNLEAELTQIVTSRTYQVADNARRQWHRLRGRG